MQITAESKYIRMSPRKVRLVAHAVRRLSLNRAITFLETVDKKAAEPIMKTLVSAIANAENNHKQLKDALYIESIQINEGPSFKRWRAASRGMAHGYKKRTSHISITLGVKEDSKQKLASAKKKEIKEDKKVEKTEVKTDDKSVKPEEVVKKPEISAKSKVEQKKPGRLAGLAGRFVKKSVNRTTNK